jgi:hypothetical protein
MNSPELCPFCHNTSVASGRFYGGEDASGSSFEPEDIQLSALRKVVVSACAEVVERSKACVHCGKVWGDLDLARLRAVFRKYGTAEAKARFSFDLAD